MHYKYKINSKEDLYKLSELASHEDFSIYISTSSAMLDAKSLLALFSILGKEVSIVAPDHVDSTKFGKFIDKLSKNTNSK